MRGRWLAGAAGLLGLSALGGCTTTSLVLSAAGLATDTSIPWAIAKHVHAQLTEGDPVACGRLDSVQRALSTRCGAFEPGSLKPQEVVARTWQVCPLKLAARDPQLWPVLPELIAKGARPEGCAEAPLMTLAQQHACPDFTTADASVRASLAWLAVNDGRAVHHDVVRLLSCPAAREAGLHAVLGDWQRAGLLQPANLRFGMLGALHPDYLDSSFARQLEATGHSARAALGGYDGQRRSGFEEALQTSHYDALDWWLRRAPELANAVPPRQGSSLAWRPLAKVLAPGYLAAPSTQAQLVGFLMARGADPALHLPHRPQQSIITYAQQLQSPVLALLEAPRRTPDTATPTASVAVNLTAAAPTVTTTADRQAWPLTAERSSSLALRPKAGHAGTVSAAPSLTTAVLAADGSVATQAE